LTTSDTDFVMGSAAESNALRVRKERFDRLCSQLRANQLYSECVFMHAFHLCAYDLDQFSAFVEQGNH
jgi:hypothetical protein